MSAQRVRLVAERVLGGGAFAEIGRPCGVFAGGGGLVAIAGSFDPFYWAGRASYHGHRLRYRLCLYDERTRARVGVLDAARFPITAVAFHPTEPIVAVGTGSYDGGYLYEGELLLWNHRSGELRNLLGESREVDGCRFLPDGRLSMLLRPHDDQEFDAIGGAGAFVACVIDPRDPAPRTTRGKDPRLADLRPVDPRACGFDGEGVSPGMPGVPALAASWSLAFEERHRVWDVAWADDDLLMLVLDDCLAEIWSAGGARLGRHEGPDQGVQIFAGQPMLVHAIRRKVPMYGWGPSSLWTVTPDSARELHRFEEPLTLSRAADGSLLGRRTRHGEDPWRDVVAGADGVGRRVLDLGGYDTFNHYLRVDGWHSHLYLAGRIGRTHKEKRLMASSPGGESQRQLWPWDQSDVHRMESVACLAGPDQLVAGYRLWDQHPGKGQAFIESRALAGGATKWSIPVEAGVTALAIVPERSCVLFALLGGRIGALALASGELLWEEPAAIDGLPTIVSALAVNGDRVAAGTMCGRVILFRVVNE